MIYRYTEPIKHKRNLKYGNNYYIFYSPKIGRIVTGYSHLEYYNLISLEMNPDVEFYCEQPVEAVVRDNLDNEERCYPDVYVYYRSGKEEIQEVKYSEEYEGDSDETLRAWAQRRKEERWSKDHGMGFSVRTEKELICGKCIQNLRYLCNRVRSGRIPSEELKGEILYIIDRSSAGFVTLGDLKEYASIPYGTCLDAVAYLYWKGVIDIPDVYSDKAIHLNTRISKKTGR